MSKKKSKWISVKKALPEAHEKVLISSEGTVDIDIYKGVSGWQIYEYVTHWMPLPEPPISRYKMLAEQHRCAKCGKPLPEGYTKKQCPRCREKYNEYIKEYYKGKCRRCLCDLPNDYPYKMCKKCRLEISQENYEKKQENKK